MAADRQRPPPGIVTRAQAADAYRVASAVAANTQQAATSLSDLPSAHQTAAATIEEVIRRQQSQGPLNEENRKALHDAIAVVSEALAEAVQQMEADSGLVDPNDPINAGRVNIDRQSETFRRAYSQRERAHYLHRLLEAARAADKGWGANDGSPVAEGSAAPAGPDGAGRGGGPPDGSRAIPPASAASLRAEWIRRRRQNGRSGYAASAMSSAWARVRQAANLATGIGAAAVFDIVRRGTVTAGEYETRIARIQSQQERYEWRRDWIDPSTPDVLSAMMGGKPDPNDPKFKSITQRIERGAAPIRNVLRDFNEMFLMTGRDGLSVMEQMGHHMTPARAVEAGQFARRTAVDAGKVGRAYRDILDRTGAQVTMRVVAARGRVPDVPVVSPPPGREAGRITLRTFAPGSIHQGNVAARDAALGLMTTIGSAMSSAGMASRGEEFLDDVVARTDAFAAGVGLANPAVPIGYAAALGMAGFGGQARRHVGSEFANGMTDVSDSTAMAAKMLAIRTYLPEGLVVGNDDYMRYLTANNWRDAKSLVESGDPRLFGAYVRFAEERAKEAQGGNANPEMAKQFFHSMMGDSMSSIAAERIWQKREQFKDALSLGSGAGDPLSDGWTLGPMVRLDQDGGSATSIARHRAELDFVEHRIGRDVIGLSTDMKDAVVIAASAFPGHFAQGLTDAAVSLNPRTRVFLAVAAAAGGGKAGTAFATTLLAAPVLRESAGLMDAFMRRAMGLAGMAAAQQPAAASEDDTVSYTSTDIRRMAEDAGVSADAYMAAIVANSEASPNRAERKAVMHTLYNRGGFGGVINAALGRTGQTGRQGAGRPYSSARVPTGDRLRMLLDLAQEVEGEQRRGERMGGVTHFMHPITQRALRQRALEQNEGRPADQQVAVPRTPEEVDERWQQTLERHNPEGIDADRVWFYRP